MAITPILADSQLDLTYIVEGFPHKMQLRCNRTSQTGGFWYLAQASGSGIKAADAADMMFTLLSPLYKPAQASFVGYQLQSYVDGAYFPLEQNATTVAPTDTATVQVAQQATLTFLDGEFKKVKVILLENRLTPANKYQYTDLGGAYLDLVNSIIAEDDASVGSWFCGRGDSPISKLSYLSLVTTYNRRLRRKRGLS